MHDPRPDGRPNGPIQSIRPGVLKAKIRKDEPQATTDVEQGSPPGPWKPVNVEAG
jgi:hypothetical protein